MADGLWEVPFKKGFCIGFLQSKISYVRELMAKGIDAGNSSLWCDDEQSRLISLFILEHDEEIDRDIAEHLYNAVFCSDGVEWSGLRNSINEICEKYMEKERKW